VLANKIVEAGRPVFAREHTVLAGRHVGRRGTGSSRFFRPAHCAIRFAPARKRGIFANESRNWWEADERPEPRSLGLLPSGPDPVGEWLVPRQPPGTYIGPIKRESKQRGGVSASFPPKESHGFVQWIQALRRTGRCIRSSPRTRFRWATCRWP